MLDAKASFAYALSNRKKSRKVVTGKEVENG
jgi:hypothetical protein